MSVYSSDFGQNATIIVQIGLGMCVSKKVKVKPLFYMSFATSTTKSNKKFSKWNNNGTMEKFGKKRKKFKVAHKLWCEVENEDFYDTIVGRKV